jgi:YidC/Oxa1 family membrane protein insertase
MNEYRNTILAVVLSAIVLIAWQFFFIGPQTERQRATDQSKTSQVAPATPGAAPSGVSTPSAPPTPGQTPAQTPAQAQAPASPPSATGPAPVTRAAALAASPRVKIETPRLTGSVALKGGRIDDLSFVKYRETVDPKSPAIDLLSPSGAPNPYYAEFGWVAAAGTGTKMPDANSLWRLEGSASLTPASPVTLVFDNGEGLTFRRTIAIDEFYLFTIKDEVSNAGAAAVTLYPFGLISRHGTPQVSGYYILHEGLVGVLGDQGLQEVGYKSIEEKKSNVFKVTNGWLGITDKYWAATLLPPIDAAMQARFSSGAIGSTKTYQTDYLLDAQTIAPGATAVSTARLFAGAKEVGVVDKYDKTLKLNRFELLIDWGWFYFITKPMFWAIDWLYKFLGNFGLAILAVTVLIKLVFFPLANKSYASMAKMKAVQPQLTALRERYPDDKMKQQQEMMEIYKREKINPLAGCLPILVQIPVFFSLYKVLFVTIEMRHAPFYGWIKDLSAPDPTNLFNLFGLLPFDPTQIPVFGAFLWLGVWPLIMGITMWVQMKLNPPPPDPTQQMIFAWMPVVFTFMLASFPAGLVIYWAWNNLLSVAQQAAIMRKHGTKIELFDNLKTTFSRGKKPD